MAETKTGGMGCWESRRKEMIAFCQKWRDNEKVSNQSAAAVEPFR